MNHVIVSINLAIERSSSFPDEKVTRLKSELRNLEPSDVGLLKGTMLFINESLCPLQKTMEQKKIFLFSLQGTYKTITHIDDLEDLFPDECFTLS